MEAYRRFHVTNVQKTKVIKEIRGRYDAGEEKEFARRLSREVDKIRNGTPKCFPVKFLSCKNGSKSRRPLFIRQEFMHEKADRALVFFAALDYNRNSPSDISDLLEICFLESSEGIHSFTEVIPDRRIFGDDNATNLGLQLPLLRIVLLSTEDVIRLSITESRISGVASERSVHYSLRRTPSIWH